MLEIKKISKSFGSQQVLNKVNLTIPEGTIQVLLGANGAGKSTLLKIIADFISSENGEVIIDGIKIGPTEYKYRAHVGYLLDEDMYLERLTATEYLEFVGHFYPLSFKTIQERVSDLIEFFDLDPGKKLIEDYSKGMKKKVAVAAALIHRPKYLILDEPFDGMDFLSVHKTCKLFRKMASSSSLFLITSHQYDIIADMGDKIALLKNGEIAFNYTFPELEQKALLTTNTKTNPVKAYLEKELNSGKKEKIMQWI